MARPLRIEFPGGLYHVTSRGDRRENIYLSDDDRVAWLDIVGAVCKRFNWACHAWCQTRDWGQVLQNNIDEFDPLRMIAAGTSEPPHGTRLRHEGERDDGARHGRYGQPDHFQAAPDENGDYRPISAGFFEWKSVACWNA